MKIKMINELEKNLNYKKKKAIKKWENKIKDTDKKNKENKKIKNKKNEINKRRRRLRRASEVWKCLPSL